MPRLATKGWLMPDDVHRIPGLILTDHRFHVPLNHDRPDGEQITVFAREVVGAEHLDADLPWLLFLQGGPGMAGPRPPGRSGWLGRAVRDYRVLLMDQRGTGLSSPANRHTLARLAGPAAQAEYLAHFRADSIVADAELIRRRLTGGTRWSVLGQSFGGFCLLHYLSVAADGVREAFFTGGLPPVDGTADDVYRATYRRVRAKNAAYYARYPGDGALARRIADHLARHDVRLPDGSPLTVPRFQQLGGEFGASTGFERVHYLLEQAFLDGGAGVGRVAPGADLSDAFLAGVQDLVSFAAHPLYALVHEAIYAQGSATRWAAERVRAEYPEFSPDALRLLFTGEMVYPWMFDVDPTLAPLSGAATLLAERTDWPRLYDPAALRHCEVPCAASVYADDMYVEREFSEATAALLPRLRVWLTNEYEHDGLRVGEEHVLDRLIALARGLA
jgi:pimeloyl-ACP methyl ester carboxylesterase